MPADKAAVGSRLRAAREERGWSREALAARLRGASDEELPAIVSLAHMIKEWEAGKHGVSDRYRELYSRVFSMPEAELFGSAEPSAGHAGRVELIDAAAVEGEIEALELARRAAASDVGAETLGRLEQAVDDLAIAYPRTPPGELLIRVRRYVGYVFDLLDARNTLAEHRGLLVVGGWLSLLGATCHIDLHQRPAAEAWLRTAAGFAEDAEHAEIAAWCLETKAWQALTDGNFREAAALSQGAQAVGPRGSSAYVQASAQEGRAWARLGAFNETHRQLDRVAALTANIPVPDRPEHHYRYDPAKADAYTATTLAWLGDPAAEPYARQVLARMESPADGRVRARRVASARLDLSLALVAADRLDEAVHETFTAVTSGVLVPSNYWRAAEVIKAVEAARVPELTQLREAYLELCGPADD
jgi:transcriptional regulator with XRE-family HTH domain